MNLCPSSFPARERELLVITQSVQLLPAPRRSLSQTDGATASPHSHRAGHAADSYCEVREQRKRATGPHLGCVGGQTTWNYFPAPPFGPDTLAFTASIFLQGKQSEKSLFFKVMEMMKWDWIHKRLKITHGTYKSSVTANPIPTALIIV